MHEIPHIGTLIQKTHTQEKPSNQDRLAQVTEKAVDIMSNSNDPFHDEYHILETISTAFSLHQSLPTETQLKADKEIIYLSCLFHDSSREEIGSNLLLQPIFDELISSRIALRELKAVGYPKHRIKQVVNTIMGNQWLAGILVPTTDVNTMLVSDADKLEVFNPERLERGLTRFESGEFPKKTLNYYVLAMFPTMRIVPSRFFFSKSRELQIERESQLRTYVKQNQERFRRLLYYPVMLELERTLENESTP